MKNTSLKYTNKVAVVTGGTRGIGKAICLKLAQEGAQVVALYARDSKSAADLETYAQTHQLAITCLKGDLTNEDKLESVVNTLREKFEKIDFLVHGAASGVHRNAMELSLKHLRWTFEINVFAIHNLILKIVDKMPAGSRIIGITSPGGVRVIPYYSAIGSSKGALESLFRHYAQELAPRGIAVNCVCPGLVLTDAIDAFPDKEARIQKAVDATPTAHLTTPEDIAELISFLCSPVSSQIVGQNIVIDGGKTLLS